jgi:hypothetical protein
MGMLTPLQGFLLNLKQEIEPGSREYLTKEQALEMLKRVTGQDFGYDAEKWQLWLQKNKDSVPGAEHEDF